MTKTDLNTSTDDTAPSCRPWTMLLVQSLEVLYNGCDQHLPAPCSSSAAPGIQLLGHLWVGSCCTAATGAYFPARSGQGLASHTSPSHHWSVHTHGRNNSKQRGTVSVQASACRVLLHVFVHVLRCYYTYTCNSIYVDGHVLEELSNTKAPVACILAVRLEHDASCSSMVQARCWLLPATDAFLLLGCQAATACSNRVVVPVCRHS
jgi:hypothetical protein